MNLLEQLEKPIKQSEFAKMVGLSDARVSQLVSDGVIPKGETARKMLLAYCERLRDQAAGRHSSDVGGLDLTQERAALARSQREAQELKNSVTRGEYAPIGLLADVLGSAAGAVADRFDQIEASLRKARPDLDEDLMLTVLSVVASARNEWIRATAKLVDTAIDQMTEDDSADFEGDDE